LIDKKNIFVKSALWLMLGWVITIQYFSNSSFSKIFLLGKLLIFDNVHFKIYYYFIKIWLTLVHCELTSTNNDLN